MTDMPNLDEFSVVTDGTPPAPKGGFDWKKSNGVKIGVAVGIVCMTVLIICVKLMMDSGKSTTSNKSADGGAANTNPAPSTSPPPPPPPSDANNSPSQETPTTTPSPSPETPSTTPPSTPPNTPSGYGPRQVYGPQGATLPGYGQPDATPPGVEKLPDDVSDWTEEHYRRARREDQTKLAAAVYAASQNKEKAQSESDAKLFIELLKPVKADSNSNDQPGGYTAPMPSPASAALIGMIVNYLIDNGTKPAKAALKELLSGEFPVEDDQAAVDAILKSLAYHPGEETDTLLLQLLTKPDSVRKLSPANPTGPQITLGPAELKAKAQELAKASASDALRQRLADYYSKAALDVSDPMVQLLLQKDPANAKAQLTLYENEDLPNDTKTTLEQYFLEYSSLALGLTTGVPSGVEGMSLGAGAVPGGSPAGGYGPPPGYGPSQGHSGYGPHPGYGPHGGPPPGYGPPQGQPGYSQPSGGERGFGPATGGAADSGDASKEKISDVDRGAKLASTLWSSKLVTSLDEQLDNVRTMEKSAPAIVLASTFPLDPMRGAMYRMLKKKQIEGPQVLETAGWGDKVLNDPGTLVLVKMLNRKEPKGPKNGAPYGSGYSGNPSPAAAKAEAQKKAENDWFEESRKLVGLWCSRFDAAAQVQRKAAKKGTPLGEPAPAKPDEIELPKEKDTKVEEAYQLNWPEKAPAGMETKPGLLKVQYFRVTQTGTIKKTMTSLTRGLKNAEPHKTDIGLWTEVAPKTTGSSGSRRSLDIVVTRADKSAYDEKAKEDPTDIEIHILAIEIADPAAKE